MAILFVVYTNLIMVCDVLGIHSIQRKYLKALKANNPFSGKCSRIATIEIARDCV